MYAAGKIKGVTIFGKAWAIPTDADKPTDNKITSGGIKTREIKVRKTLQMIDISLCFGEYHEYELIDNKVEYWENQLLDLGKRNKMISFRETCGPTGTGKTETAKTLAKKLFGDGQLTNAVKNNPLCAFLRIRTLHR